MTVEVAEVSNRIIKIKTEERENTLPHFSQFPVYNLASTPPSYYKLCWILR